MQDQQDKDNKRKMKAKELTACLNKKIDYDLAWENRSTTQLVSMLLSEQAAQDYYEIFYKALINEYVSISNALYISESRQKPKYYRIVINIDSFIALETALKVKSDLQNIFATDCIFTLQPALLHDEWLLISDIVTYSECQQRIKIIAQTIFPNCFIDQIIYQQPINKDKISSNRSILVINVQQYLRGLEQFQKISNVIQKYQQLLTTLPGQNETFTNDYKAFCSEAILKNYHWLYDPINNAMTLISPGKLLLPVYLDIAVKSLMCHTPSFDEMQLRAKFSFVPDSNIYDTSRSRINITVEFLASLRQCKPTDCQESVLWSNKQLGNQIENECSVNSTLLNVNGIWAKRHQQSPPALDTEQAYESIPLIDKTLMTQN